MIVLDKKCVFCLSETEITVIDNTVKTKCGHFNAKIKRCPCCNSDVRFDYFIDSNHNTHYRIFCNHCGLTNSRINPIDLTIRWNKRCKNT